MPEQPAFLGKPAEAKCYWFPGTTDSHLDDSEVSLEDFQTRCYVPVNCGCTLWEPEKTHCTDFQELLQNTLKLYLKQWIIIIQNTHTHTHDNVKYVCNDTWLYLLNRMLHYYNSCNTLKPKHHYLVSDFNIGPNILHTLLQPEKQTKHFKKSRWRVANISWMCCSHSPSVFGFD